MRLWLQIRGAPIVLATMAVTVAALALPASALAATPSPAGATLAAACLLALAVPVAVGWGCARGDAQLESVGVRPIRAFDFLLAVLAVGATSAAALAMQQAGLAPAGAIAGRAALTYLGFMLLASPLAGWRVATIVPAIYFLAVAVIGGGEDIYHPARWAWIAADGGDRWSWVLTFGVLASGVGAYLALRPRTSGSPSDE